MKYTYRGSGQLDDPLTATCHGVRGTVAGYARHYRAGERPCDKCRAAQAEYAKGRRAKDEAGRDKTQRAAYLRARRRAAATLARRHAQEFRDLVRRELTADTEGSKP